jgi:(p)ppGpp synthase/HD superfamily hydrolase
MAYGKLREAIDWAFELHKDQRRKVRDAPFIAHLLGVTSIVLELGGDEEQAIAAMLHDSVEDQGVTVDQIRERFGGRVAHIVDACTDSYEKPKKPWYERKLKHLAEMHDRRTSHDMLLVMAADKVHNVRSLVQDYAIEGPNLWERFRGGTEGSIWYFYAMAEVFREHGPKIASKAIYWELERLHRLMVANGER